MNNSGRKCHRLLIQEKKSLKKTIQYLAPRLSTVSVAFLHKHINLHETDSLFEITLANEYEFQVGLDYGTMVKKIVILPL